MKSNRAGSGSEMTTWWDSPETSLRWRGIPICPRLFHVPPQSGRLGRRKLNATKPQEKMQIRQKRPSLRPYYRPPLTPLEEEEQWNQHGKTRLKRVPLVVEQKWNMEHPTHLCSTRVPLLFHLEWNKLLPPSWVNYWSPSRIQASPLLPKGRA